MPDEPRPDPKDWTWVLDRVCPECGFDAVAFPARAVASALVATVPRWVAALGRADSGVRADPAVWSTLEYAAHVRDVCKVMDERLRLMLTRDDPELPSWDQDATALADAYAAQDPARVAAELTSAASSFALHLEHVGTADWLRPGRRSDGYRFTVDSLSRYALHDVVHHLYDVHA